jgi:putative NADH-flavin reductase
MKVIIFGATGMVGQGVLRECLLDDEISSLLTVGPTATGVASPKLHEIQRADPLDYRAIESRLAGFEACLFRIAISAEMKEADYERTPLLQCAFPSSILTTELVGLTITRVAKGGVPRKILEAADTYAVGRK